jgi:AraC-like DNA-binding protein
MTSATWPEAEAFVAAVQRTPADAVTMAAGWTAHDVLAHAVAGGAALARLLDAHLKGELAPPTQTFAQREPAFRALSYEQLTGLLAAGGLKQSLDEMATRNTGAALDFTGWTMGATDLATHVRSELTEAVSLRAGFGSQETMRRAFLRVLGVAPSDCRARFRATTWQVRGEEGAA